MVRKCGEPDLIITFTCNPNWPEIQAELLQHQTATDRPDLVARVFKCKLDALLKDVVVMGCLGKVQVPVCHKLLAASVVPCSVLLSGNFVVLLIRLLFLLSQAYTYTSEFQKRGLPHAHMLFILKPQ